MGPTLFALFLFGLINPSWCSHCESIHVSEISADDVHTITEKHNELRKLIATGAVSGQPRGTNLKKLKYDQSLALDAQKIANTCEFAHKTVNDDRWMAVGQNLFIMYSTAPSPEPEWPSVIQSWFDEYRDYEYGVCCYEGPKQTGHYTQLVWADTEYVGCGFTYFAAKDFFKYRKLYVCNYGPAGNYRGRLPYIAGDSGCEDLC